MTNTTSPNIPAQFAGAAFHRSAASMTTWPSTKARAAAGDFH
jgi:hypothetical protein